VPQLRGEIPFHPGKTDGQNAHQQCQRRIDPRAAVLKKKPGETAGENPEKADRKSKGLNPLIRNVAILRPNPGTVSLPSIFQIDVLHKYLEVDAPP
jgi:hypothetical protein